MHHRSFHRCQTFVPARIESYTVTVTLQPPSLFYQGSIPVILFELIHHRIFRKAEKTVKESLTKQPDTNIVATMDIPNEAPFSPEVFSPTPSPEVICCEQNELVVSILIGLIVVLGLFFIVMIVPPLNRCILRHKPVSDKRIERRYETIEGWIISKVRERERQRRRSWVRMQVSKSSRSTVVLMLLFPSLTESTLPQ
jgi:hypothetical protein